METTLKELLTKYEIENNLSHSEAAKSFGVHLATYYRWLNGESTKLKRTTIEKLSELLDYDIEALLERQSRIKPVIGRVKAGYDFYAEENIEDYIELGQADAQRGDYFLRVEGDSMEGSHIYDGDLVFVEQCNIVSNGQIAIVVIGDEATIKKIYFKSNLLILEASNPKYETKYFTQQEVEELQIKIIGLVRFVRHDFC